MNNSVYLDDINRKHACLDSAGITHFNRPLESIDQTIRRLIIFGRKAIVKAERGNS